METSINLLGISGNCYIASFTECFECFECDLWPVTCDLWPVTCDLWPVKETCRFRRHFCSGFAFDSITFYSLLAIYDSSETIRIKGIKDQLCAIFLASVVAFLIAWRGFPVSERERSWSFYFAVEISRFITFYLRTDQLFSSNFCGK